MENKVFDVCLHVGTDLFFGAFYEEVKKNLESRGVSVLLFTLSEEVANYWDEKGVNDYLLLGSLPEEVDENFCLKLIEQYGFDSIATFYRTEAYVFDLPDSWGLKQACRYIHAIYAFNNSPRALSYCTYEGDEFEHNAFRLLCRMHNGKMNYFGFSNLMARTHFHKDERRYWATPVELSVSPIPDKEKEWIEDYIKQYTSNRTILWGDPKSFDIQFKWNYFLKAWKKIIKQIRGQIETKYYQYNFFNTARSYVMRLLRRQFSLFLYKKMKLDGNDNSKYYYFPLHVPHDSQLTQRGLPFYDQASLVRILSQYISYPYKLIVKEHPQGRGYYKISTLNRIKRLPNVILVPPGYNSHDIISKADAVFAINSSVGYEAIMYKKPVVALGRSFYRDCGVTIDINSLYELEDINSKIKRFSINDEDVINFIWRVKKSTYDLTLYPLNAHNYKEKIEDFSVAIYEEVYKKDNAQ